MPYQYKGHREDHCTSVKHLKKHPININGSIFDEEVID